VKTIADAQRIESTLSGTGAGSTVSIYPTVMNNVLGTKFKLIMGYRGSSEAMLAVERGEVEGHSTSWTALKVAHPDWIEQKNVTLLVQFALKRHRELPDLPTAVDLARDEERQVLSAVMNATEVGTAFFHHAGRAGGPARDAGARSTPPCRIGIPRLTPRGRGSRVNPITGEELQKLVTVPTCPPACWTRCAPPITTKTN
jgi:hypothetical protein